MVYLLYATLHSYSIFRSILKFLLLFLLSSVTLSVFYRILQLLYPITSYYNYVF
ncbi:hypothetical protein HMPREF9144_2602 [Prevotella pallens ATCC 700821]|uniref:Uncharacterized protein n=1 Tax=Prevotella pallens ATCC 700821 TaxID=997353 RepID=F9DLR0_9BACT|nr:hypothetical protein HMPREF9144_2602 [Prevotella pallens ATCC 700821]